MRLAAFALRRPPARVGALVLLASLAACGIDDAASPYGAPGPFSPGQPAPAAVARVTCTVDVRAAQLSCTDPTTARGGAALGDVIIGGQRQYVYIASRASSYSPSSGVLSADVTITNLIIQPLGTSDGATPTSTGTRLFLASGPTVTAGTGTVTVFNADGVGSFTGTNQPYFQYSGILQPDSTSSPKLWQFMVSPTVQSFTFGVFVATAVPKPDGYIDLIPEGMALAPGASARINTVVRTAAGGATNAPVAWSSSDTKVATVDASGQVTAVAPGSAVITATSGSRTNTAWVDVRSSSQSPDITIRIEEPNTTISRVGANQSVGVTVTVQSRLEVRSVAADIGGRRVALTPLGQGRWTGTIAVRGLPRGPLTLTVTATDVNGTVSAATRGVNYDAAPVVIFDSPGEGVVARPIAHVHAFCHDDDPAGCAKLRLLIYNPSLVYLAEATDRFDQDMSFSPWEGSGATLTAQGEDAGGYRTEVNRAMFVESSAKLSAMATVQGTVLDADADRVLYVNHDDPALAVRLRTPATGADVTLRSGRNPYDPVNPLLLYYVTLTGALFMPNDGSVPPRLYEWRNGSLTSVGSAVTSSSVRVKGRYAIWNAGSQLVLRDLLAATNTIVSNQTLNNGNDVAANGDVVYSSDLYQTGTFSIYRSRAGVTTRLTDDDPAQYWDVYPRTDGTNVVFQVQKLTSGRLRFQVGANIGGTEVFLTPLDSLEPSPGHSYQANGGWIAYTQDISGVQQVWTRAPDGSTRQVSTFPSPSYIDLLMPDGGIYFIHGSRRYYAPPRTAGGMDVSGAHGTMVERNGEAWLLLGNTVFRVTP